MDLLDFQFIETQLNLHPSTLQYARRAMKASKFWSPDGDNLRETLHFYDSFRKTGLIY
jgi:hypothetical protein